MIFTKYHNHYVFHLFPNFVLGQGEDEILRSYQSFGGLGYSVSGVTQKYPVFKTGFKFFCNGLDRIAEIDELFDHNLGRFGYIWFPSWNADIELTQHIGADDTTIHINDIEYTNFYPEDPGTGRHLFFYKT